VTLLKPFYLIPTLLILTACISFPDVESTEISGAFKPVTNQHPICIKTPGDPSFQQNVYLGAGNLIAEKVRSGVEKTGRRAFLIDDPAKAEVAGCRLVIDPQIIEYEDRVTGWSGLPDRISLRLSLFSITDKTSQRSLIYTAKSSVMGSGFLEWGNATPASLLQQKFYDGVAAMISE
jgi:hypothetical protein